MKTVGAHEARAHFGRLLTEVEQGEAVVVTRHGVPVARLVPMGKSREDSRAAMEEVRRFREEYRPTLGGITIRELIEEGRE